MMKVMGIELYGTRHGFDNGLGGEQAEQTKPRTDVPQRRKDGWDLSTPWSMATSQHRGLAVRLLLGVPNTSNDDDNDDDDELR